MDNNTENYLRNNPHVIDWEKLRAMPIPKSKNPDKVNWEPIHCNYNIHLHHTNE